MIWMQSVFQVHQSEHGEKRTISAVTSGTIQALKNSIVGAVVLGTDWKDHRYIFYQCQNCIILSRV